MHRDRAVNLLGLVSVFVSTLGLVHHAETYRRSAATEDCSSPSAGTSMTWFDEDLYLVAHDALPSGCSYEGAT